MNLQYNLLTGNILFMFNNSLLQYMYLGFNNLSGILPSNVCQGIPNLRYLYLFSNDLSGEMPKVWRNCKELEDLELSYNNFDKGSMPAEIGKLTKLQYLYLSKNNLEGEIPFSIFNSSSLMEINLDINNLNGSLPHEMCQFPQLEILTLHDNHFRGIIPRSIGNCTLLQRLTLVDNFFTGSIPIEFGHLNQLQFLQLGRNNLSGAIPSKIFNISTLKSLLLEQNSLFGNLPLHVGFGLPNLLQLHMYGNNFFGNIPSSISNASNLVQFDLSANQFSGIIPDSFGDLRVLESLIIAGNNLTLIDDSHESNFFTSLTSCRYLRYLDVSENNLLSKLPNSIGNLSLEDIWAHSCGIYGNIPLEIGNMSNLIRLSMDRNDLNGVIPSTIKGLNELQSLDLEYNGLQGSIVHELCEIRSLSELYLTSNKLFGVLPTCLGNMTSLRKFHIGSNRITSKIPSSFWNIKDILEVNLSSNALIGNLPLEIKNLRALILLDLSKNQISSNIPTAISFLTTLETLSLAYNKLNGPIPTSLGEMLSLSFLDLSQNLITGVIPKSLVSLSSLKYINLSYNRLQGEIPDGGPFKSFTAQSFMHNDALCGRPRLQVPPCDKQIRKKSKTKMILIICILSIIVVLGILVVACIMLRRRKRKKVENPLKSDLPANLGFPRRISYYEIVKATNGFSESNLLGKGGFGSVYQGMLSSGKMVAIKVLDLTLEATSRSFDAECNAMRNLRHRNLVQVISSCSNDDFKSLVMEFMSNGSVEKWLHSENYCLDFLQRLNIMLDVAFALEYLHHGSLIPVVHCDLKPSNVLLDEDMVAHVSDFGISKLLDEGQSKTHTQTLATLGYVAPEYGSKGVISIQGDVYSYGIMLMEMFTRKKPTNEMFSEELNLKTWISESMVNSVMEVVDYNLVSQHEEELHEILALALSCCADSPEARIKMTDVTASLIKIKTLVMR
ncbi:unnamed protein product [Trifolium pratense]|uniref:Uncharacterized protein n=1 Tax=Trifolium pratense TaxID=57577 RepID=A0ACB0J1M2_TRIPR|nr:unnamed protein product [Trifolium pratense]